MHLLDVRDHNADALNHPLHFILHMSDPLDGNQEIGCLTYPIDWDAWRNVHGPIIGQIRAEFLVGEKEH